MNGLGLAGGVLCIAGAPVLADIGYLTQDRSISAMTSADGNAQSLSASSFAPFVESLNLVAEIPTTTGPTTTRGNPGIDCQLDPNAIRANGSLTAAGGISIAGGSPTIEFGEARADVFVTFTIDRPTTYLLVVSPRPSDNPDDDYEVKLRNTTDNDTLVELNQTTPPQAIDQAGVLAPATYLIRFSVELHSVGEELTRSFNFNFSLGVCGSADFDGDGNTATDADIEAFFACLAGSCCAACGSADFDADGDGATDADIEAFFRVVAGGTC